MPTHLLYTLCLQTIRGPDIGLACEWVFRVYTHMLNCVWHISGSEMNRKVVIYTLQVAVLSIDGKCSIGNIKIIILEKMCMEHYFERIPPKYGLQSHRIQYNKRYYVVHYSRLRAQ